MKKIEDIMEEVSSLEYRMIRKTLVFRSPITQDLDYRVAYFTNSYEAMLWEENMESRYKELTLEYSIYTDIIKRESN